MEMSKCIHAVHHFVTLGDAHFKANKLASAITMTIYHSVVACITSVGGNCVFNRRNFVVLAIQSWLNAVFQSAQRGNAKYCFVFRGSVEIDPIIISYQLRMGRTGTVGGKRHL